MNDFKRSKKKKRHIDGDEVGNASERESERENERRPGMGKKKKKKEISLKYI